MIILTILLWCLLFIVAVAAVIVFSPFQARLLGAFDGSRFSGRLQFSFLHPAVLRVSMNFTDSVLNIRVFGWQPGKKRKKKELVRPAGEERTAEPLRTGEEKAETSDTADAGVKSTLDTSGEATPVFSMPPSERSEKVSPVVENVSEESEPIPGDETVMPESAPEVQKVVPGREPENRFSASEPSGRTGKEYRVKKEKKQSSSRKRKETVAPAEKKKDNWIEKIKRSIVVLFLADHRWRSGVLRWVFRFLTSLLRLVKFDRLRISVRAGVENPMITGTVSGYMQAIQCILSGNDRYLFSFEPVFMRNFLAGSIGFRVQTSIATLLFPFVYAIVTFPLLRTLWLLWKYYRKKRRFERLAVA